MAWCGFVIGYALISRNLSKTENTIRSLEQTERSFLSLQEPLLVYLETKSSSQKIRFGTILRKIMSRMPEDSDIAREDASLFDRRVKGMLFQIQTLGALLFNPDIGMKDREQITLSLTNLLFETVHNDIRPFLDNLRTRERQQLHQLSLIVFLNFLLLCIQFLLLLGIARPFENYVEQTLLKPLENLSAWARRVAKGDATKSEEIATIPGDAEMRDLVESIQMMKDSLVQALGQSERKLQHNELLSMIIQASGFMSREEDILDVSRQALMAVFSGKPVEIHFQLKEEDMVDECWAIRKGGLVSDEDWNGLVRCHQCVHANTDGTYLCSPIQSSDETIGTITLRSQQSIEWLEEDRSFLRDVAAHVGMSLSKLRLLLRHRNEAILDPLTGLYNRRYLEDYFQRVTALVRRHGKPYSFIMLDIDHFKQINDRYGHESGDHVLRELSEIIRTSMRQGEDTAARIGGEEFALIVVGDRSQAFVVAEKIRKKAETIIWSGSQETNVTISAGLSEIGPVTPLAAVMKEADEALYRAKREGRNRTVIAHENENLFQEGLSPGKGEPA